LAVSALKHLCEADPLKAAIFLEELEAEEAGGLLGRLPDEAAAACLKRVHPKAAGCVLDAVSPRDAGHLLSLLSPEIAADIFRAASKDSQAQILRALGPERKKLLEEYLSYPQESAGRLMSTDFAAFPREMKVRDVITRLRAAVKKGSPPMYAYVVGEDRKLLGVLVMRDLLFADPGSPVESAMTTGVRAVSGFTDQEELVQLARDKRYLAVPVVDSDGRIMGSVKMGALLDTSQEEASEDIQLMFGGGSEEKPLSSWSFKVTQRLPWLSVNLATAFLAGSVVALFEDLIARIAMLAVFLPIIAGQGGNAGTQTLAVMLRGLIMREVKPSDAWKAIGREMLVGGINGAATGAVTAGVAWAWKGNAFLGIVVGMAMVVNLIAAGAAGAGIPLLMKRFGFDPAQSSGIILTTVTDVVGFFAFLGFAALFQSRLIGP